MRFITLGKRSAIFIGLLMLFSCEKSAPVAVDNDAAVDTNSQELSYEKLYSQILENRDKALALNSLWTTASPLLADSQEAAQQENYDEATEFALEANKHIELSIQQAELEKENWKKSKDNIFN